MFIISLTHTEIKYLYKIFNINVENKVYEMYLKNNPGPNPNPMSNI